jgi:hypothetical protein
MNKCNKQTDQTECVLTIPTKRFNIAKHFQMLKGMSVQDLAAIGQALGFGETIDNSCSVSWNANASTKNVNGCTNTSIFSQIQSFNTTTGNVIGIQFIPAAGSY